MAGLAAGNEPYHVTLTTPDGLELGLISVGLTDGKPHDFEGSLTPVDATEQFRPGGIPREFADFSAGAGYSHYDDRVPTGYAWSENVWTLVPHLALPSGAVTEVTLPATNDGGTHGEIRCGFDSGTDLYISTGKYCVKIPGGTGAATQVANFASTATTATHVVTSVTSYLGKAYWGGWNTSNGTAGPLIEHTVAADNFTIGTGTCSRWHVASFGGLDANGTWTTWLIGSTNSAAVKYTNSSSPLTDGNWTPGTAIPVGDQLYGIMNIVTSRQAPFIVKQDGVFALQRLGQYVPNITPHWKDSYHVHNGVAAVIVAGALYASTPPAIDMVRGLDGQLNDSPFQVHPGADLPNETPVGGTTWAFARDGDWVIAAQFSAVTGHSYLSWGKPRSAVPGQPGLTPMIWHSSPCIIENARVSWMKKFSANDGTVRLWIATRNQADTETKLYWLSLPRSGNVFQELNGGTWRCRTDTCTLYLPANPWSQGVHSLKALRQVAVVSKEASETSSLTPYVSIDGATRATIGGVVTESPYAEARILSDMSGREIAPSVDFLAGSSTTPPILRSLTLWAGEGVRSTVTYRGRFRFAHGLMLRNKSFDRTSDFQAQFELLIGSQGPRPASLIDWKGNTYTVAFEQGAEWVEREVKDESRFEIDVILTFTILARAVSYDDGAVYDSGTALYA